MYSQQTVDAKFALIVDIAKYFLQFYELLFSSFMKKLTLKSTFFFKLAIFHYSKCPSLQLHSHCECPAELSEIELHS